MDNKQGLVNQNCDILDNSLVVLSICIEGVVLPKELDHYSKFLDLYLCFREH